MIDRKYVPIRPRKKRIPVSGPSITKKEVDYVAKAAKEGWYKNATKYVSEFEKKFADFIGVKYAIATDSCTGALQLSLIALGIDDDDEVIVPDITWISTAAAAVYVGAKPVFADMEPDSWCIDPADIEKKITKKTRAIIPVHLYGHPVDMNKIMEIAKKHKLFVIEDAAQSIGSTYYGKQTGSFGDTGCFSFFGAKLMVTGEGGILVTNNKALYEKAKFINSQGQDPKKRFWHLEIGFKTKMSGLQAALGTAQLSRIKDLVKKKRRIFSWYKQRLDNIEALILNVERDNCKNNFWMPTIILDKKFKIKKEQLMSKLLEYNIDTRPFFYPLSAMPPFKKYRRGKNPIAYALSDYAINLPSSMLITKEEVDFVCKALRAILRV